MFCGLRFPWWWSFPINTKRWPRESIWAVCTVTRKYGLTHMTLRAWPETLKQTWSVGMYNRSHLQSHNKPRVSDPRDSQMLKLLVSFLVFSALVLSVTSKPGEFVRGLMRCNSRIRLKKKKLKKHRCNIENSTVCKCVYRLAKSIGRDRPRIVLDLNGFYSDIKGSEIPERNQQTHR